MKWLTRHKTLATAIGVALATIMLVFVAALPIYQSTTTLLSRIQSKTVERDELVNKVSLLSKLDKAVTESRVKTLDAALPPRKDVLLYLSAIDGLSRELGLTFGGLSLAPGDLATGSAQKGAKPVSGLQTLETAIKVRGGQESIYTFLRTIEQVLPLMQIKDIKVSVLADEQYALSLTLGMLWAESTTADVRGNVSLFGAEEEKYFTDLAAFRQFSAIGSSEGIAFTPGDKSDLFAPITAEASEPTPVSTESAIPQP